MFNPESLKDGLAGEWILLKFHFGEISLSSVGEVMMDTSKLTNLSVWQIILCSESPVTEQHLWPALVF